MTKPGLDTLIISDIHLASSIAKAKPLKRFLKRNISRYDRLIILGDLFDSNKFSRLNKHQWKLLSLLRSISEHKEIIWVEGNHDSGIFCEIIASIIGAKLIYQNEHFTFKNGLKLFICLHGHQFDIFTTNYKYRFFASLLSFFYYQIQKIDTKDYYVSRLLKRKSKLILTVSKTNQKLASEYAKRHGADVIICGHTHSHTYVKSSDQIEYVNSGSWTESPSTYVEVDKSGLVRLNTFT